MLPSTSCCLRPAVSPLNKRLHCLVLAHFCHSTVLAVRIRAAKLTKGDAEDSGAAPMEVEPEMHKQSKSKLSKLLFLMTGVI